MEFTPNSVSHCINLCRKFIVKLTKGHAHHNAALLITYVLDLLVLVVEEAVVVGLDRSSHGVAVPELVERLQTVTGETSHFLARFNQKLRIELVDEVFVEVGWWS